MNHFFEVLKRVRELMSTMFDLTTQNESTKCFAIVYNMLERRTNQHNNAHEVLSLNSLAFDAL